MWQLGYGDGGGGGGGGSAGENVRPTGATVLIALVEGFTLISNNPNLHKRKVVKYKGRSKWKREMKEGERQREWE